ncbi:MAG: hypothetical protein QOH99_1593 [Frankiaceae bacterium]|nr:hypothetical protein [Frankiaceae bacterium]
MRFRALLQSNGKSAAGFVVPPSVVEGLGAGGHPKVTVTVAGHTYRSSIAKMGGTFMLGMSNEHRALAGIEPGSEFDVEVELDTQVREVEVPEDLAAALDADPAARAYFDKLSYSNKLRHVLAITGAKAAETRERRIAKSVELFHDGRN